MRIEHCCQQLAREDKIQLEQCNLIKFGGIALKMVTFTYN